MCPGISATSALVGFVCGELFISICALLILHHHSGRHLAHFKSAAGLTRCRELSIHFLKTHNEGFNLLSQGRNGLSLFLHCLVLFEKLIEQHRVHRFIAHAIGPSFFATCDQIGPNLFHLFSHKAKLRDAIGSSSFL